jgi:chemotaxis protein MotB
MNGETRQEEHGPSFEAQEEDSGSQDWLITFADLTLILLVFFVLLFAISTLNEKRFQESFVSVRRALGSEEGKFSLPIRSSEPGVFMDEVRAMRQLRENQKKVFSDLTNYSSNKGLEGIVGAHLQEGEIKLTVPSSVLFPSGKVQLTPEGKRVIKQLKNFFVRYPDQTINIQGHTDNVPPSKNLRFKDNWEISSLRAINVLRTLVNSGVEPNRLTATGFADLQPLVPNSSPENRARNRRVEFVLKKRIGGDF